MSSLTWALKDTHRIPRCTMERYVLLMKAAVVSIQPVVRHPNFGLTVSKRWQLSNTAFYHLFWAKIYFLEKFKWHSSKWKCASSSNNKDWLSSNHQPVCEVWRNRDKNLRRLHPMFYLLFTAIYLDSWKSHIVFNWFQCSKWNGLWCVIIDHSILTSNKRISIKWSGRDHVYFRLWLRFTVKLFLFSSQIIFRLINASLL